MKKYCIVNNTSYYLYFKKYINLNHLIVCSALVRGPLAFFLSLLVGIYVVFIW